MSDMTTRNVQLIRFEMKILTMCVKVIQFFDLKDKEKMKKHNYICMTMNETKVFFDNIIKKREDKHGKQILLTNNFDYGRSCIDESKLK